MREPTTDLRAPGGVYGFLDRHGPKLLVGLAVLAVVLSLLRGLAGVAAEAGKEASTPRGRSGEPSKQELVIESWLAASPVRHGQNVSVWYRLSNESAAPVEGLELAVQAPGFTLQPGRSGASPVRLVDSDRPAPLPVRALSIPAGEDRSLRVTLRGNRFSGTSSVTTIARWRQGGEARATTVEVTGIEMVSYLLIFFAEWLEALMTLILTLGLPAALAVVGWSFQEKQQLLAQERQAWAEMLPVSHENNVKYYLPLLAAIDMLERDRKALGVAPVPTDDQRQRALFALLVVLRGFREAPGFYFIDREGEWLTATCQRLFIGRLFRRISRVDRLSALIDVVTPKETISTYRVKLRTEHAPLAAHDSELGGDIATWVRDHPTDFELLELLRSLMKFEVNRIYEFWYGDPPAFPAGECRRALESFRPQATPLAEGESESESAAADRRALAEFVERLEAYVSVEVPRGERNRAERK